MLVVSLTHYRTENKVHTSLWENAALNTEMSQKETGFLLYRRKRILVGSVLAENYKRLSTLCYCNFFVIILFICSSEEGDGVNCLAPD